MVSLQILLYHIDAVGGKGEGGMGWGVKGFTCRMLASISGRQSLPPPPPPPHHPLQQHGDDLVHVELLQDMSEGDKYTCPLCVRALQQQERREQRKAEAAAAAEIEREAKEAQAARKAKLVCMLCPTHKQRKRLDCITTLCTHGRICAYITQKHQVCRRCGPI